MKLTYWCIPNMGMYGGDCYSIRAKTKKEALAFLAKDLAEGGKAHEWDTCRKVEVDYDDGFDLLMHCLSEGRIYEGKI